jgi:hypothetical protein
MRSQTDMSSDSTATRSITTTIFAEYLNKESLLCFRLVATNQ